MFSILIGADQDVCERERIVDVDSIIFVYSLFNDMYVIRFSSASQIRNYMYNKNPKYFLICCFYAFACISSLEQR
jgi:hypothetical protein